MSYSDNSLYVESSLLAASAFTTKPIAFLTVGARRTLFFGAAFAAGIFRFVDDSSLTWAKTSSLGLGQVCSQYSRGTKGWNFF
jgi:hypothetical protein